MFALALLDCGSAMRRRRCCFSRATRWVSSLCITTQTSDGFAFASEIRASGGRENGGQDAFARCADVLLSCWAVFSEPVTLLDGVFFSPAWAPHAGVCAGTAAHAARAGMVGRYAEPGVEGGASNRRFLFLGEEFTDPAGKCRARAPDCVCSSGIVSFQRFGFERDAAIAGRAQAGICSFIR